MKPNCSAFTPNATIRINVTATQLGEPTTNSTTPLASTLAPDRTSSEASERPQHASTPSPPTAPQAQLANVAICPCALTATNAEITTLHTTMSHGCRTRPARS